MTNTKTVEMNGARWTVEVAGLSWFWYRDGVRVSVSDVPFSVQKALAK